MLSFHNDIKIKEKYLARVKAHRLADNLVQGQGWEDGKGCAVGCTLEAYDHTRYPIELGIPEWLAHLEDRIFEGLSQKDASTWPERFLNAIPVGSNLEGLEHKLAIKRCMRLIKLQKQALLTENNHLIQVVQQVIQSLVITKDYHSLCLRSFPETHKEAAGLAWAVASAAESAARSAAWAAESAARAAWAVESAASAARSAARSAVSAARSAVESVESVESVKSVKSVKSVESAARSAAWAAESAESVESVKSVKSVKSVESAARSAAWAAESAARAAAWAAESAAESAAYKQEAKDLLSCLKEYK